METPNEQSNRGRLTVREFPWPWRPYEIEFNTIRIVGNIVKVYCKYSSHRGIILDREPADARWEGDKVVITFSDNSVIRIADDGCWEEDLVYGALTVRGNDVIIRGRYGKSRTIHCEEPVIKAQWIVIGSRHVVWVALQHERRYFSSPGFYDYAPTIKEQMDSLQKICDKFNAGRKPPEEIQHDPDEVILHVRFIP